MKDDDKNLKIHTGFRLSAENYKLLEKLEIELGLNKTGIINMILTLINRDKMNLSKLIHDALKANSIQQS